MSGEQQAPRGEEPAREEGNAADAADATDATGSRLLAWIDERFPLSALWRRHFTEYRVPRNLNVWYVFGSLALLVLVIQLLSGIFLTMHYKADAALAFESVERIVREVRWGWLIRYVHSTGASLLFVVLYLHIFRGMIYGSYRKPRELVWLVGCFSFLCLMAEAFFGYLLPWGQMSYWGAQVIVNLFSAIPGIGPDLAIWVRGDYLVSDATLNRFFAFHVIAVPLLLALVVVLHLSTLRQVGSNNPDGIDIRGTPSERDADTLPFHPYFVVKDIFAAGVFLTIFASIVFLAPSMGGYFLEANNFVPANPLMTPAEIAPVWYFTPFYSMLRATTDDFKFVLMAAVGCYGLFVLMRARSARRRVIGAVIALLVVGAMAVSAAKLWGVVLMMGAVLVLFFLPWLDRSPVRSIRYRPRAHVCLYGLLVVAFVTLGVLGIRPPNAVSNALAQGCTLFYFGFFLCMPWWSGWGRFLPEPERVTSRRAERATARRQSDSAAGKST